MAFSSLLEPFSQLGLVMVVFLTSALLLALFFLLFSRKKERALREEQLLSRIRIDELSRVKDELQGLLKQAEAQYLEMQERYHEAEKQLVRQSERIEMQEQSRKEWEAAKEEHMNSAKAAVAQAGAELSSKLLDDHKREAEDAKKLQEESFKKNNQALQGQFETMFQMVSKLHGKVEDTSKTTDMVRQALLSPTGAGGLAEITLENIFKASHLVSGQDYITQFSMGAGEGAARPDAVVFLPAGRTMVVDSKASKFFLEMTEGDDGQAFEAALKKTMQQHVKDLVKRDYKSALEALAKEEKRDITSVEVLMFLPSDEALARLQKIDPRFMEKAWQHRILPVGPSTLLSLLIQGSLMLAAVRQEENAVVIMQQVQELLSSVNTLYGYLDGMGKNIKHAFDKYDALAGSFNRNFLVKADKFKQLGVQLPKAKDQLHLPRYQVMATQDLIDLEAEEEGDTEDNVAQIEVVK